MVNKRRMGGMVAAFFLVLAFPALASAHTLSVSAGPSQCASPLNGEYTATVTITEQYFSGTTENIPVGQNVKQLASSTDTSNTGLNQNYFTQGAVGTQTGPVNLGQPTSFTSPSNGATAMQTFTVTTSVPETYVLGNSHMGSPSSTTISAPKTGCTPTCPSRRHARQRRVRATHQLPQRRDADERRVRATDKLPERPSPVSR